MHYTATLIVTATETTPPASGRPVRDRDRITDDERYQGGDRNVREVAKYVIRAKSLDSLRERLDQHVALIVEDI